MVTGEPGGSGVLIGMRDEGPQGAILVSGRASITPQGGRSWGWPARGGAHERPLPWRQRMARLFALCSLLFACMLT